MNISNILNKKPTGETITFTIDGMHCTSCSLTIDMELEETPGVIEATTNFATSKTKVVFDANKITEEQLRQKISEVGYSVVDPE